MSGLLRAVGVAVFAVVVLGAMACQSSGAGVVYVSEVDGDAEIYVVDPDSGEATALVQLSSSTESDPRVSPDGETVAFVSGESGVLDIKVAEVGEEESVRSIAAPEGNEESPRWNAEGDALAYVTDQDGHTDVYVTSLGEGVEGEQNEPVRITADETDEVLGDWSPDGEWLVFSRRGDEEAQGLWLRNPAGVNLFQMTSENDLAPTWSPDGDAIAFVRNVEGNRDIYLLRPEDDDDWRGAVKETRVIASPKADHSPAWAPDGDTLVYVTERDGNAEIYVIETDTDDPPMRLTTNEAGDSQPVWSPDGDRIAFVSDVHGEGEIFVMDADGSNQRRLTHNEARDHSPDW